LTITMAVVMLFSFAAAVFAVPVEIDSEDLDVTDDPVTVIDDDGDEADSFNIVINDAQKDVIKSDKKSATAGETVTLTVPADVNPAAIGVLDEDGKAIPLTKVNNTTYTFKMPASDVSVGEDLRLNSTDHFAYIKGYPDGSFKPNGSLTRAEAATIFYRLLVNTNVMRSVSFSDVKAGSWYYEAVSVLAGKGVIKGYPDGTFGPNRSVTRAEFCAMASRFFALKDGTLKFTDVKSSYWGYPYIASAVAHGWLTDAAAAYKPDSAISRAEVVNLVNRMLGRKADKTFLSGNGAKVTSFTDVKSGDSCYLDVMEAANAHNFKTASGSEAWTGLK
ncbi:MAG: S-layer homology domain-containing protein, partial [Clostridia bacterium]|nr:S-layer homology domain-containing protein [Clostridia bacterium]